MAGYDEARRQVDERVYDEARRRVDEIVRLAMGYVNPPHLSFRSSPAQIHSQTTYRWKLGPAPASPLDYEDRQFIGTAIKGIMADVETWLFRKDADFIVLDDPRAIGGVLNATPMTCLADTRSERVISLKQLEAMMRSAHASAAQMRRSGITLTVVAGQTGNALQQNHPTDGLFIECSYHQAKVIEYVLGKKFKLSRILDADRAEFVLPVFPHERLGVFPPPYEVRPDRPPEIQPAAGEG